ncbi:unnamed protein product [Periconia digitata]|uniref:Uncharacterized protein n=1 Tax=Periconia digitata TaxID=1303443 RepID=A0A9W4UAG2_9PLEO|nr:unnamed protein product [Periconia digitata]
MQPGLRFAVPWMRHGGLGTKHASSTCFCSPPFLIRSAYVGTLLGDGRANRMTPALPWCCCCCYSTVRCCCCCCCCLESPPSDRSR